ncbi:MAG: hypothetical protein JST67_04020 [Bacteroidetes bacterium]|nr:hypothetical protein [Bacteroidota bacterium]
MKTIKTIAAAIIICIAINAQAHDLDGKKFHTTMYAYYDYKTDRYSNQNRVEHNTVIYPSEKKFLAYRKNGAMCRDGVVIAKQVIVYRDSVVFIGCTYTSPITKQDMYPGYTCDYCFHLYDGVTDMRDYIGVIRSMNYEEITERSLPFTSCVMYSNTTKTFYDDLPQRWNFIIDDFHKELVLHNVKSSIQGNTYTVLSADTASKSEWTFKCTDVKYKKDCEITISFKNNGNEMAIVYADHIAYFKIPKALIKKYSCTYGGFGNLKSFE